MSSKKPEYFIDKEDELMYLEMLEDMDMPTAKEMYSKIKQTKPNKCVSGKAIKLTFEELTYRNLRYLILGCQWASAEIRVKALAAFISRSYSAEDLSPLVSNEDLRRRLHDSMLKALPELYRHSGIDYFNIEESLNET